jgi:orotate phosphoribosyltransferase
MPAFDQDAFNRFVIANKVYGFFDRAITLKSGRTSHFYANFRDVVEDAFLAGQLVEFVIAFVTDNKIPVDTLYGVPEGATKLGVLTQYTWAQRQGDFAEGSHVLAMGRAKPKEHGAPKDRYFVGAPKGKVVVLEDVTTTGGSLLNTLEFLKECEIDLSAVVSLTNRMEKRDDGLSVEEAVAKAGVDFYSLSTAIDLLPIAVKEFTPADEIVSELQGEFDRYGVKPIRLR